jgi:hypothetical protein
MERINGTRGTEVGENENKIKRMKRIRRIGRKEKLSEYCKGGFRK